MSLTDSNLPILTVTQLSNAIKLSLEGTFPVVYLQGEVSNAKLHSSGHFYFTLKDAQSQIGAILFRMEAQKLAVLPKEGSQVIVLGEVNVYPAQGKYQILVKELRPVGIGELLLRLEELKVKLNKLGYFRKERKRPLPKMPRKIGVVTSPTGAAIQDMLNILTRRFSSFHLILNPVKVQGEGAAQEIAQAIRQFNQHKLVDVIIVGRGGGSIEDLWAFNEEIVAEAIFNSEIPIISAVGHETDHCIADYVADVRAPTPSAAAEIVIGEKAQHLHHLAQLKNRLVQALRHTLRHHRQKLEGIKRQPLFQSPYNLLAAWIQKLDHIREDVDAAIAQKCHRAGLQLEHFHKRLAVLQPSARIKQLKLRLAMIEKNNEYFIRRQLALFKERLNKMAQAYKGIDPKNLLSKGYTIVLNAKNRSVITSSKKLVPQEKITLIFADGEASAFVAENNSRQV